MKEVKEKVIPTLSLVSLHKGQWGIELKNGNVEQYFKLKRLHLYDKMFAEIGGFLQGDTAGGKTLFQQETELEEGKEIDTSWIFIEFWSNDYDRILNISLKIAEILKLEIH